MEDQQQRYFFVATHVQKGASATERPTFRSSQHSHPLTNTHRRSVCQRMYVLHSTFVFFVALSKFAASLLGATADFALVESRRQTFSFSRYAIALCLFELKRRCIVTHLNGFCACLYYFASDRYILKVLVFSLSPGYSSPLGFSKRGACLDVSE